MSTIASLDVDLALNTAKFIEGIRRSRKDTEDFATSLKESFSELGEQANRGAEFIDRILEPAREAQEVSAKLAAVLKATGEAAGIGAKGMDELAEQLAAVTTFSAETAKQAETILATFTHIRGDQFREAIKASADLATIFGTDLTTAAQKVGRALENPADGLRALAKMGVQFSESQKATIERLVETGQVATAQGEIIKAINAKVGGSAAAAAQTAAGELKRLSNEFRELQSTMTSIVLPAATSVEMALKGIAAASDVATKALSALKAAQAGLKSIDALSVGSSAATIGGGIGAVARAAPIVGAGLAIGFEFIESLNSAYQASQALAAKTEEQRTAHIRAAEAARQHAAELKALADTAHAAAMKGQLELSESLVKEANSLTSHSLYQRIAEQIRQVSAPIEQSKALINSGRGTAEQNAEFSRQVTQLKDLQRALDLADAAKSQELAAQHQQEMQQRADSIRQSIMTPLEKFQQTLRDLSAVVQSGRLNPAEAAIAAKQAAAALVSSNPAAAPAAAAALERGTAAAYSAGLRNERQTEAEQAAAKQLEAARKMAENVEDFGNAVKQLNQQNVTISMA